MMATLQTLREGESEFDLRSLKQGQRGPTQRCQSWMCYCWPAVKRLLSKIRGPKGENWDGIACEQPPPPRQRRPLRPPRSANLRRHLLTSEISEREVIKTSSLRKMTHSVGTLGQQRVNATESSLHLNEKMAMGPRTL